MTENMKKFMEALSEHPELGDKVADAGKKELFVIAKELGIELTEADLEQQPGELSDDELDAVAGGADMAVINDACGCVVGGGGKRDSANKVCACVAVGVGYNKGGDIRCTCAVGGVGAEEAKSGPTSRWC